VGAQALRKISTIDLLTLRQSASAARAQVTRLTALVSTGGIVAKHYVGTLAGGNEPLELLYIGREAFAREFEPYVRLDSATGVVRARELFRGNLATHTLKRLELARRASAVDVFAAEVFPSSIGMADDELHFPMLEAHLPVRPTMDEQIRGMSHGQRAIARDVVQSGHYTDWLEAGDEALERFYTALHVPFVHDRFGVRGKLVGMDALRVVYARHGRILLVAQATTPNDPIGAALLYDKARGVLGYHVNGFAAADGLDARAMARRTMALELALIRHARSLGYERIDLGYARAVLNDGVLAHKRRLGCTFAPLAHSPCFRVRVRPGRRVTVFSEFPLLGGHEGEWSLIVGARGLETSAGERLWRSTLKSFQMPGLAKVIVWVRSREPSTLARLRELLRAALEVPAQVELRLDA
jgi:hypothetical protein